MSLDIILQAAVGGLLLGGVYMLLAAGLTLIFGVMRVINFAQADFMMLGMFTTYLVATTTGIDPLLLAVPVGMALAALGMGFARYFLERVPRGDHNAQLILTLGVLAGSSAPRVNRFRPYAACGCTALYQRLLDAVRSLHQ